MFTAHGDDVGMTSLCSHHIHITLMMSSLWDLDVIVTMIVVMVCDRQTLCATGRPSHMTYRPW